MVEDVPFTSIEEAVRTYAAAVSAEFIAQVTDEDISAVVRRIDPDSTKNYPSAEFERVLYEEEGQR